MGAVVSGGSEKADAEAQKMSPEELQKLAKEFSPEVRAKLKASLETIDRMEQIETKANVLQRRGSSKSVTAKFVADNPGMITDFYTLDKKRMGEGGYGYVVKGTNKSTSTEVAVKTICKEELNNVAKFKMEIDIQKSLDHPNICKICESFEDHRDFYIVLELCTGGELFDRIVDNGPCTEVAAAHTMQQAFRAINYMHGIGATHRDLKPENFIFLTGDEKSPMKLIDFGLACWFTKDTPLTTKAGTPYYVAPQVMQSHYDEMADVWSLGVIMYVILCGYPPFFGDTDGEILHQVALGRWKFVDEDWTHVSEKTKQIITNCLAMDPKKRSTAQQVLDDPFFEMTGLSDVKHPPDSKFIENFRSFADSNKFKKTALQVVVTQLGENQLKSLKDIFLAIDTNGNGKISFEEFKEGLAKVGIKDLPPDLADLLKSADTSGQNTLDYTEFLAASMDRRILQHKDLLWSAFRVFDRDGNGTISVEELKSMITSDGLAADDETIANIMKEVDKNGDQKVDFDEFAAMMQNEKTAKAKAVTPRVAV